MNDTIVKFGYPATLVREYDHWVVLLRPAQATLGSMVLAHKSGATRAGELDAESWSELARVKPEIEATLKQLFGMEKINYLMLMMVDREVHSHVIPRYGKAVTFQGVEFDDPGWPKVPDLGHSTTLTAAQLGDLAKAVRDGWVGAP